MLDIRIEEHRGFTAAYLAGRIGEGDAERLTDVLGGLAVGGRSRLAIDLSGVKMIDSSGLSVLISLVTRSRLSQGRLVLIAPSPFVSGVFAVAGLDTWFEICKNLSEAQKLLT